MVESSPQMNSMSFGEIHGIKRQFSTTKTLQQNGLVERKNRTVQEAAKTMFNEAKLPDGY